MTISTPVKSAILLVLTLGIGMLLGALLQARLAEQRLEQLALLRSERGLTRALGSVIEPIDEAQRVAIDAVLKASAERMAAHIRQNREESVALLDSTMQALHAVLDEAQIEQLNQRMERWDVRMRMRKDSGRWQRSRRRDAVPPP